VVVDEEEVDGFLHALLVLGVLSGKKGVLLFEDCHE
jgi:hypothetical protein